MKLFILTIISLVVCLIAEIRAKRSIEAIWTCETDYECQIECGEKYNQGIISNLSQCEGK